MSFPSIRDLPTPTNEPLGRRERMGPDRPPNVCACHAHKPSHLWLAYSWEDGCPLCGSSAVDVRCGARYRPELCRNPLKPGSLKCALHTNGQPSGASNPAYKDGRTILASLPFRVPASRVDGVVRALGAGDDGLRPHAALLDGEIDLLLARIESGASRPKAIAKATALLDGDPDVDELREALAEVLELADESGPRAELLRVVAERRKLAVADARIEATAHEISSSTVEFFVAWSYSVGLAIENAGLAPEAVAAVRRAIGERLQVLDSSAGRRMMPLERSFTAGSAAGRGKLAGYSAGEDEIDGEVTAAGEDDEGDGDDEREE